MICPACKQQIPDDSDFCPLCGTRVTATKVIEQQPIAIPIHQSIQPQPAVTQEANPQPTFEPQRTFQTQGVGENAPKVERAEKMDESSSVNSQQVHSASPAEAPSSDQPENTDNSSAEEVNSKPNKMVSSPIGLIGGVLFIIVGVIGFMMISSISLDSASFGADFYTYTYNGIKGVFNALVTLTQIICAGFVAFGVALIGRFK